MFTRVYNKVKRNTRRGTSFLALVALLASAFTYLDIPTPANAAIVSSNLVLNLDASSTSSLAATGATGWNSVSPASSTATSTFFGNTTRVSDSTGASLAFDGTGDAAYFPAGTARTPGAMTVETWIKPGNLRAGWNVFASRWFPDTARTSNAAAQDWHLAIYGSTTSNLKLQLNAGSLTLTSNTIFPATSANKWYHVAFTIDAANTATLWINGVADGTMANFPHTDSATAQLHVGDVGDATANCSFTGNISRFRIYNTSLTAAQLAQNYLTDSATYGYAPANTVVPTVSGVARVGTALSSNQGTWGVGDATGTTTAYQWQSSANASTWTNISGATAATYTPVAGDATNYLRLGVTKTNSAGSATAYSDATQRVQTTTGSAILSGGKLTGLTSTVPNDANTYNVTLATDNLSARMVLGTTTGLTLINGYASTAAYMATTIGGSAPIISFRGTGTAINTALANVTYTSSTQQVDVVKLYYASGGSGTDTKDYFPIYDNNQLTFHYYAYKTVAVGKNRAGLDAVAAATTAVDSVESPGPWYLTTIRYKSEWDRLQTVIGQNQAFMGALADAGSTSWYWPANTDGYSSATIFGTQSGTSVTATSTIFNQTNTTLPFQSGEPNAGTAIGRTGFLYPMNSVQGWDDTPLDNANPLGYTMETFGTAPFNVTLGSSAVLAQTVSVVTNAFDAPSGLTVEASGTTGLAAVWNPVTPNLTGLTLGGYRLEYSTSSSFSPLSVVITQPTVTSGLITGLAANTTYYVRVLAAGTSWGAYSSAVTVTTKSAATTITVVSSGGGVAGTDYTNLGGQFYAKASSSVSINASDIQTALNSGNVAIAADNVIIDAPITWNSSRYLTLGNSTTSTVTINKTITSSVAGSQLIISPTTYTLDVKNGASIQFTAATTQYLNIGGTSYTLIKTEAQLVAAAAGTNYALAKPLTLATSYTTSPIAQNYSGKFDGLGNSIDGFTLNAASATGYYGLFQGVAGGTIRNLGVTNVKMSIPSFAGNFIVGAVAGDSTGGTLEQVWSTGFISTAAGSTITSVAIGGLIGNTRSGTLNITKSWSSVNIDTFSSAAISYLLSGSLVGGDLSTMGQVVTASGGNIVMNQVYSTGGIRSLNCGCWRGHGGLLGLHFSTATISITDAFFWSNFVTADTGGVGGLIGNSSGGATSITNAYTVYPTSTWSGSGTITYTNVQNGIVAGAAVSAQNGSNWITDSTNGTYLKNLQKPYKNIYVQVVAPGDGSYSGMSYQIIDGAVQTQTLSSLNLSTTGNPVYSILSSAARGSYNVSYVSGLTLGGTAAGLYNFTPWPFTTAVTITRLPQTFTWAPTTAISFGTGTFTPSAAPVSSAGSTITYAVSSAGTTGCTVNSTTGAVTYNSAGSCTVTATAAATTDYTGATVSATFTIADASTAPTVTAQAANTTSVQLSWTAPTVNSSVALSGYQILYSTSSNMASPTTISTGTTATTRLITGLTSGTTYYFQVRAIGGSTWIGPVNVTPASTAPKTSDTTITVVASGGGTLGTDYKIVDGVVYAVGLTANVNVADIQNALLTQDVSLAAENVVINSAISWSTSSVLTLGSSSTGSVSVNGAIATSGVSGGVKITPSTYSLSVKAGGSISFTGSSPSLTIGGTSYTLIKSEAELVSMAATGNYALAKKLNLTTAYTTAVANINFTGTFDGLGNTVNRMNISASAVGAYGLFANVSGSAALRNVGVTNAMIKMAALSGTYASGMIVGRMTGGTVNMDQVWSSGLITTTGVITAISAGGIIGNAAGGTLNINKSWSNTNIDTSLSGTGTALEQGGIIGGDEATLPQQYNLAGGASVYLNQVYATGNLKWVSTAHRGIGGLFGLHYASVTGTTITDSFSWVTFASSSPTGNLGGIFGVAAGTAASSIIRGYQATSSICTAAGSVNYSATPSCDTQQTPGTAVSGITGAAWASNNGTTLVNLPTPSLVKTLYVQPVYTANGDGTFGTLTYQIVDGTGAVKDATALTALNLSVSGTATYTIDASAAVSATPYSVDYVSGLTLGGTAAANYSLAPWFQSTSATISKLRQTVTWTPTTSVSFGSGTFTPDALPVGNGGGAITYALSSAGTTGCTVNSSTGAITATNGGSCAITATAAANGNYVAGSTTVTFTIADPATLPTVTARASGTGSMVVSWTTPTVSSSVAITGYTLKYSTASSMTSPTTVNINSTNTSTFISGLATNTTYYFQVRAIGGSTWTGSYTAAVSGSTLTTANTMTIAASGGATQGTGYFVHNGVVYATGNVTINASDINTLLANNSTLQLAADTVNINAGLSWSTNAVLTLGNSSSSTVNVNSTIAGSGATAGIKILPSTYSLSVKDGAYIRLTGATPSFNLGGTAYIVVNTVAGLSNVLAGSTWALTAPITLTATYTAAVKDFTFTGTMDGLGNTVNNMTMTITATKDAGFYASLGGATVRNVGFTNVNISSPTDAVNTRLGSVAGNGSITASVTNNVSQVWATGFLNQTSAGTAKTEAGGLFGGAQTGTLNITKSWSSVAISTKAYSVGSGGIIGTNVGSFSGGTYSGAALTITESYSTGNILRDLPTSPLWYGNAGIIGVSYGTSTTISNVFSWGNINSTGASSGTSTAGISGVGAATITNAYTTHAACGGTATNCVGSVVAGTTPTTGTGFGTGLWSTTNGASLVNLTPPTKALYVQVIAPTDGSYGTMSYQIVDSTGTAQTLSSLSLTVSGTPTYTITAATAKGTYSVAYVSGLTLGGTSANVYSLGAWITNTSVTITKFPQTVTWTPTLTNVFGNGTLTPSASAISDKGTTITYSVASAGTTGCTVNASTGVITYTSAGTCTITASGDSTGDYLASTVNAAFVISAAPTITIVTSGGGVSGTDYTIANGLLTASANVSVNASDLATALASGNVQLAGNVVVNAPITWSSNSVLTLGGTSTNTVAVNSSITGSGATAGIVIKPTTYSLSIKNAAAISLSGATPTLSIGGNSYTLVKSIANLATVTTTGFYALAVPLTYSTTIDRPAINLAFAGTFDGLGNTVDNMRLTSTANLGAGFFKNLNGGTIRNLGVTNEFISLEPTVTTNNLNAGGLVGDTAGGTLEQVWTTGSLRVKAGSTFVGLTAGGLVGDAYSGTLNISKSWSALHITGWGSAFTGISVGGILGADFNSWASTGSTVSGTVVMNQVYSLGDLAIPQTTGQTAVGGILGNHLGSGTVSITDALSWSMLGYNAGAAFGGTVGVGTGGTVTLTNITSYTSQAHATTGTATFTKTNVNPGNGFGATISALESQSNWSASGKGTSLANLPAPYKNFYVQVVAPTDGSYSSMTYRLINGVNTVLTPSTYNVSITGTPVYSIASDVAISATPYNVDYVSGLTFGYTGTNLNAYRFSTFVVPTAVTISKYPQTVTWSPTTSVAFSSGSITPSALATASGGTTITYSVTDAGTTGCTVNATTAVIAATAGGNCVVTATAANAGNYLAATASVTFAIADASAAPSGVTTTPVGTGAVMVNWTAPTPAASTALNGYQVTYSTSASMTSPTTVTTSTTSKFITGLTANTTYYFQVRAVNGTTWYGAYSTAVTGATPATGTTLTVATTGGTQGTTWKVLDGIVYPVGTGIINAADLQSLLLTGSVTLAADTVTINSDVTWNTSQTLTLGYATANSVNINADITASGTTGGLVIAPATYSLATKNNAQVILSGSSTTLSIGGVNYTLIRSISGLASVTATGNYALSQPLTFGTTALTAAPINVDFTGTFDGLGNTLDGLTMTGQSSANSGLFNGLSSGSFVRNLGITNVKITIPGSATNYVMVGVLAGWVPSGQSGTATVNKVWTTGFVNGTSGSLPTVGVGGLVAWARSGTLSISQSWSSVNIDTSAMSPSNMTVGGLVGTNAVVYGSLGGGANVSISESYTSGNLKFGTVGWRGNGGIMGLSYATGTTTTVTDSFSYGTLTTADTGNLGGIVGGASQGTTTLTRVWTTQANCSNSLTTGCLAVSVALGAAVTGANTSVWTSSGASYLVNLPAPKRNLYVQTTYTNVDGSFAGVGNQVVDGVGAVQTLSSLNLTKSGTPTYTIDATTAVGTYNVAYTSGLTFGGTAVGNYNFLPYPFTTSVAITKVAQTISYTSTAPTTAKVNTTYTPTATSSSSGTVTFTIDASSSSICSIASGVVTFNTLGNCVINANQAGATNWLAAPQVQQTAIATVKGDQTVTYTTLAPTAAKVAGATYTPTGTSTSGGAVAFTIDSTAITVCSITAGVVSFLTPGTCIVDADQAGNTNWSPAPQVSQTFTVAKGDQSITFTSSATTPVVGGSTYLPAATKTAGTTNTITFSIDSTTSTVCSISAGAVSFLTVGTCKVNADVAGDSKYNAATTVTQSITVGKGSQTISFSSNAPNAAKVGGSTYAVAANAGPSTGAVTLSVDASTSSKCSVSGLVVTYLAVGDCLLNLNQAGDTNYIAATQVQQTVTITSDGRCPNGVVSGNYCLIRFNTSGTWTVPAGVTAVDMLTVGGGGGGGGGSGGQTSGGGGGGGEVIESTGKSVTPGTRFTIVVGAGGLGGAGTASVSATAATDGSASSISASGFTTITARGGGHGGSWRLDGTNANIGTSLPASSTAAAGSTGLVTGGGGSAQTSSRANAAGNGDVFNGGAAKSHDSDATLQSGGGGGGAGGAGSAGTSTTAGAGGSGKNSVIFGALLGGGGGGGKRFTPGTAGTATAGGGAGGLVAAGTAGTANTGGGGGGSGGANDGANGGSGVVVIRVALTSQTVAFTSTAPTGLVYGTTTTYTPTVSGTASEVSPTITVDASSSSVCSIAAGVVSIIGAGTCTLNANQDGNGFYAPSTQVQQSFTVAKQAQAITFTSTAPTNAKYSGSTYTVTATGGGSGNAVTFTIDSTATSICSISSGVVSFTGVGTCVINANQATNTNYLAAPQVQQSFSVGKATPTLAFTSTVSSPKVNTTYTPVASSASTGAVTYTIDASSTSGACNISAGVVSFSAVGTCVINANQVTDTNYLAATQVQQSVTIVKGDQTITISSTAPTTAVVNGTTYTPTATSTSTGTVAFTIDAASSSVCSIAAGVVSFQTVGTCKVLANQAGNANWNAATQVFQSFSVGKGSQTITFTSTAPTGSVVSGATYLPSATATGGGSVTFTVDAGSASICSITSGSVTFLAVGTCKVLANQSGDTNWNAAAQVFQSFSVGKGSPTLAFTSMASAPKVNTTYSPVASSSSTGAVTYAIDSASSAICSITAGIVSFNAVGTCTVNASQVTDTNWLSVSQVQQNITVAKGDQSISFTTNAPTSAVVDGSTYIPATSSTSGGAVSLTIDAGSSAVCEISSGTVSFLTVGTCTVLADQAGNDNWNSASQASQTFTVGKGSQVVTITSTAPNNAVVDGATYTVSATGGASTSAVVIAIDSNSSTICSVTNGLVTFEKAGDCVIQVSQAGDSNYNAAPVATQTIVVGKGAQAVAFTSSAPTGVRVGDSGYTPTATGGSSTSSTEISVAPASSAICTMTSGSVSFIAVGSCVLNLTQAGDANYNAANTETQTITVAKGLQAITKTSTDPQNAVVAGATYTPTFTGGNSGSPIVVEIAPATASQCTVSNGIISFIGAGDCDYTVNQAGSSNYEAAPQLSYTISVGKGSQATAFTSTAPTSAAVGGATYSPTATGGASGNAVTFRIDVNTASVCAITAGVVRFVGVGTCTVTANQSGSANYLAAAVESQSFSVGKGAQTISFTSSAPTNAVVAGATYTPVATGGATGNTVTFSIAWASSSICSLVFGKVNFHTVGDCVIEANQAGNTNYNAASLATQTVSVGKGAQTVSFTSAAPSAKVAGATYTPVVAGGASGNSVALSIAPSSSAICSVNNGVVSFQAVGSCVVQADQAASSNYEAATQVTQTITVAKGVQILAFTSTPPSLRPVQGTTYVPTVTAGASGEPVVYTIDAVAASICEISSGVISFLAVGDCVLHADQAGDSNFTAATRVTQIFDITKGEQVVNFSSTTPVSAVVDGSTYTPTGTGGAGSKPVAFSATDESAGICAVLVGVVYFQGAGSCVIEINQAGDINYNPATSKFQTITVGKGTQTITFTSTNTAATVDGSAYTPTFTDGNSINAVHLSVASASSTICEINSGAVSFHAVGDCVIEANQAEDSNYFAAPMVTQTIAVAQGNQVALVGHSSVSSLTLGTNTPTAVLTTTGGSGSGDVVWRVASGSENYCSVSGDVVSGLASGYCDLIATKVADVNYHEVITTLSLVVSTGGQTPIRTSVSNDTPTYADGLTLDLSLTGGDGEGAIWYESLTTHVCNVTSGSILAIYHAGTCTVVGHKNGDDNFEAVADELIFTIAKATQSGASIHLANDLVYSPDGAVSAALSMVDVQSDGAISYSVTNGSCTIVDGALTATDAGDCDVTASIVGDDRYLDGSFTQIFNVAKAAQTALAVTLTQDAPAAIAWNGVNHTSFTVTGGSGTVSPTVDTTTPAICSVAIENSVVTVTGLAQGTCEASVSNSTSANFLAATTVFSVEVLDLAAAPTSVTAAAPVRGLNHILTTTISWTAPTASATNAEVTGFKVQSKIGNGDWTDVVDGSVDAATNSLVVTVSPWTKYNFRVASTSALDGETLNWEYFDLSQDDTPDVLAVGGSDILLSTTKAATTSGETVFVDGSGFVEGYTTRVQLVSGTGIFTAGIRAAALVTTKTVTATYVSPTRLSFVLPKITLPKGVLSLTTQIKVLSTDGLVSEPIPLDYIPKKLAQTLTAVLPANVLPINVGSTLQSVGTILSSSLDNPPVVTATPASVCTALINSDKKLVITPVSPGACSISVVVPGTPAYLPSAVKSAVYTIKTYRTAGFSVTASNVDDAGTAGAPITFTQTSTLGQSSANLNVSIGDEPVEIPVTMSSRQGTITYTVLPADEAAGRCTADTGDLTGLVGVITIQDVGSCKVTISQAADAGYYAGETIILIVNATARPTSNTPAPADNGSATLVPSDELASLIDPKDLDDPLTPPVALAINPDAVGTYAYGTEDGLDYDPLTGKLSIRSRTAYVGVWTAKFTSPATNLKWFKTPTKIVKGIQQFGAASNTCTTSLTVKKDAKLKKKVTRVVGNGCYLTPEGKSAMTSLGIKKIKVKYKRTRQYAKTGLDYQGTAKAKKRILKKVNRTIVLRIGRAG